jgi:16S rRNA (cytosine967-C5)-methyltransferase
MNDYVQIVTIISETINGNNLRENFNKNIQQISNISKVKDITYGVIRNYYSLKLILDKLISKKIKDQQIEILLLIALYEIKFSKKPQYACVNEIVTLANKNYKYSTPIKNFINAVLRSFIRQQSELEKTLQDNLSYKYNFPQWLVTKIIQDYPNNYENILLNLNQHQKYTLRVNNNKTNLEQYCEILSKNKIEFKIIANKIVLSNLVKVEDIPFFSEGLVSIQNINAQKLLEIVEFKPNDYLLDACSAPGGKLCQILENYNNIEVLAADKEAKRLIRVEENLKRLELKAKVIVADMENLDWWNKRPFNVIIADVPCSASGTIKTNPDIKLNLSIKHLENIVLQQRKIVKNLWNTLLPGGKLIYITCSIFNNENSNNIKYLLDNNTNMHLENEYMFLPDESGDGFYYAVLTKIN